MKDINIVELASEAAASYTYNLAQQLGEDSSYHDPEEGADMFTEKYQEIFNEIYDIIYEHAENNTK